jgi:hypothetical protein
MKKLILAASIALIFNSSVSLSDDSGYMDGGSGDPDDCATEYDPEVCSNPDNFGGIGTYAHKEIGIPECEEYTQQAITNFFGQNHQFAVKVHRVNVYSNHETTFVDRDYYADTKSSYGCVMGLETHIPNAPNPYTIVRYSVSETYVDGLVIYINDYKHIASLDYDE